MSFNTAYHHVCSLFHSDWYESFEYYRPSDELLQIVRALLPGDWRLTRNASWFGAFPSGHTFPKQGWKIHISATPLNCEEVLRLTSAFCIEREIAFKFALDASCVMLSTSPLWPREASGKFITIYAQNESHFCESIEALYTILQHLKGPYILSDRRYKDSEVIYYRYGGITGTSVLSSSGHQRHLLLSPQGELVPDQRTPYWNPPVWVRDPFEPVEGETADDAEPDCTLKGGRYHIQRALKHSVAGGVYIAADTLTANTVIIKEARRYVNSDLNGRSASDRLQREYEILQKLQGTGITPVPIDLFWDWEHLFLVEEYFPGPDLSGFVVGFNPLIKTRPEKEVTQDYVEKLKKIWCQLAQAIATLHERGVIYGDFSLKNIIISESDPEKVRIVDLETAWEEGSGQSTGMGTRGFVSSVRSNVPGKVQDMYAFGAIMLGTLFPINQLLALEPTVRQHFLRATSRDLGLSQEIPQLIERCMSESEASQPTPQQAIEVIQQAPLNVPEAAIIPLVSAEELLRVISETTKYIHASADFSRDDRLFPADPAVFSTNPLSIAYGAAGVVYALSRIEGEIPMRMRAWLLSRSFQQDAVPAGLYMGLAGIAWVLWEVGLKDTALHTLKTASHHPLVWETADIFYGAAGYGLTCLRFYLETRDQTWLECALRVGEWLVHTKTVTKDQGYSWPDQEGTVHLGYARGASGIALYLFYLALITDEARFLEASHHALAFDLAHLRTIDEHGHLSVPRKFTDPSDNVILPYWLNGCAGVATVLLRFWISTGETRYREVLEHLIPVTAHRYAIFPGLFQGLSGLGNFLLDAYQFTGQEKYLEDAYQTAQSTLCYQLERPQGVAFPGDQLLRISTDFGTGGAGIALFLHRLVHAKQQQSNFNFTLDHLLPENARMKPAQDSLSLLVRV